MSFYRTGVPGSLSGARSRRHLESAHRALLGILETMCRVDDGEEMRSAAADLCQRFVYDYHPLAADLVSDAERRAGAYGGSRRLPLGGAIFRRVSRFLGWKTARHLQILLHRLKP